MGNLVTNVLNLFVSIFAPAPERKLPAVPLQAHVVGENFQVDRGKKIFYKKESWYAQEVKLRGKVGDEEFLLIQEMHGDGCPAIYNLLVVEKDGDHENHSFGNCMDANVTKGDSWLEFTFEGMDDVQPPRPASKWKYEKGELAKVY